MINQTHVIHYFQKIFPSYTILKISKYVPVLLDPPPQCVGSADPILIRGGYTIETDPLQKELYLGPMKRIL